MVLSILWNVQKTEEDISVAAKAKAKEVSMEEDLWKSADKLRGSVEPSEYKHVVLRFLRFLQVINSRRREQELSLMAWRSLQ